VVSFFSMFSVTQCLSRVALDKRATWPVGT